MDVSSLGVPVFGPPTCTELLFGEGTHLQGEDEYILEYGQKRYICKLDNMFSPFVKGIHDHIEWPEYIPEKARDHVYRYTIILYCFTHAYPG